MRAKFEVSSLTGSVDMEGSQNFKSRSRDPFTPVTKFCTFSLVPLVDYKHAKVEMSTFNHF